jgi:hypothetical protein
LPDFDKIDGYELKKDDQYFHYPVYPKRLEQLENRLKGSLKSRLRDKKGDVMTPQRLILEMKSYLKEHRKEYKEELKWVKTQWYFKLFGYWFWNNGVPTYIDGWHYSFLTAWTIGSVGSPQYRDRDKREFIFKKFIYTNTETFAKIDENGYAIAEPDGSYKMKDLGRRVFFGVTYPGHRRGGKTNQNLSIGYDIITLIMGSDSKMGMISFTKDNIKEIYREKMLPAFKAMPFYFKPIWDGSVAPQSEIVFNCPANIYGEKDLKTKIDFATTSDRKFYDSQKLYFIDLEEEGKTTETEIEDGWRTIKRCLSQGDGIEIHGFATSGTTVEDMQKGGGTQYLDYFKKADFYKRDSLTGQTETGLVGYFISGIDGLEGFIGKNGESVIEKPTKEQALFIGKEYGSKQFQENKIAKLLKKAKTSPKAMEEYKSEVRKCPTEFKDCFIGESGSMGLNTLNLESRKFEIQNMPDKPFVFGNFYWYNNIRDGTVIFKEEAEGRWCVSEIWREHQTNRKIKIRWFDNVHQEYVYVYAPENIKTISSSDPFMSTQMSAAQLKKNANSLSDGGGSVLLPRDKAIDPDEKPVDEWETFHCIASYRNRVPDDDIYCEDMLLASIYYQSMHYPESNVKAVIKYFIKKGYAGYLLYDLDDSGKRKPDPGIRLTSNNEKDELFKLLQAYTEYHVGKENHLDLILECLKLTSIDEWTNLDILASFACCLKGATHPMLQEMRKEKEEVQSVEVGYVYKEYF